MKPRNVDSIPKVAFPLNPYDISLGLISSINMVYDEKRQPPIMLRIPKIKEKPGLPVAPRVAIIATPSTMNVRKN